VPAPEIHDARPVLLVRDIGATLIGVANVDALYEELEDRGATIDYGLYDAPHGFREFGTQDPDGYDIAFGQPLG
jgi:uncharacterized glyoxalase superfamily protein PhnB